MLIARACHCDDRPGQAEGCCVNVECYGEGEVIFPSKGLTFVPVYKGKLAKSNLDFLMSKWHNSHH